MAPPPPPPMPKFKYDKSRVEAALAFLRKVRVRFESTPAIYEELCTLLGDYHNSPTAAAAAPVLRRTAEILHGHRDLVADFNDIIHPRNRIPLPAGGDDDDHAAARPRRNRKRPRHPAAVADESNGERREPQFMKAKQFINNVKDLGGDLWDRVGAMVFAVNEERSMDAHAIYNEFTRILAPDHLHLLQLFADAFLPKPPPSWYRKYAAAAAAEADAVDKQIRAVRQLSTAAATADAVVKQIRAARQNRTADIVFVDVNLNAADNRKLASRPAEPKCTQNALDLNDDGDGNKTKKARVAAAATDVKIKRHPLDGDGDTCWHVTTQKPDEAAVTFRKMLDFMGWYTKLVTTIKRAEELERQPQRHHGALQDLFPSRDCHEILKELYGDGWRTVQVTLGNDHGGRSADRTTLARILRRLRKCEDKAVELVKRRRDKIRYPDADVSDRRQRQPCSERAP